MTWLSCDFLLYFGWNLELASIKWGQYISGPEGELKLPKGKTAIGFDTDKRTYFLGFGNVERIDNRVT